METFPYLLATSLKNLQSEMYNIPFFLCLKSRILWLIFYRHLDPLEHDKYIRHPPLPRPRPHFSSALLRFFHPSLTPSREFIILRIYSLPPLLLISSSYLLLRFPLSSERGLPSVTLDDFSLDCRWQITMNTILIWLLIGTNDRFYCYLFDLKCDSFFSFFSFRKINYTCA